MFSRDIIYNHWLESLMKHLYMFFALLCVLVSSRALAQPQFQMRDLCIAPDGPLFISTSNRDGRGTPRTGDDRIIELRVASSAATITTGAITPTQLEAGQTLTVRFTVTGTFNDDNVFTAQLSDMNGSFTSPVKLGEVAGTGDGDLNVLIP